MEKMTFPPIYDEFSKVLILGSFPSVKSRENDFYYQHPQNRFWKLLEIILDKKVPKDNNKKIKFLLENNIALYDAIESCSIKGSSDSSIELEKPADLTPILETAEISAIFTNGKKAYDICRKKMDLDIKIISKPSTSPANAQYSLDRLVENWQDILEYLK